MMETKAIGLIEEDGTVKGVKAKNKQGVFEIRAELVIGADGRHSTVRQKANLQAENKGAPVDVLWFSSPGRLAILNNLLVSLKMENCSLWLIGAITGSVHSIS